MTPFTTDGCSGLFMRTVHWYWLRTGQLERSDQVKAECMIHDESYWRGGSASERVAADSRLVRRIADLGCPFLARWMFLGVSIGGHPWLPLPWRWGYGWKWPRGYRST